MANWFWCIISFELLILVLGQDCQLQYVAEPPSTISCNPYTLNNLELQCVLRSTLDIGRRMKLQWLFAGIDGVARTPREANVGFSLTNITISNNTTKTWNLTSSINLTLHESSMMNGEWFCQPAIDGIPVLPSNKLNISEVSGNTSCNGIKVQESMKCAYFLKPSSSVVSYSMPTLFSISPSRSIAITSTSTGGEIIPSSASTHFSSTLKLEATLTVSPSSTLIDPDLTTMVQNKAKGSGSLAWVYALSGLVIFFALIIIGLITIFLVFLVIRRKKKSRPLPTQLNSPGCGVSNNDAYGVSGSIPVNVQSIPVNLLDDPVYAEISQSPGESFYILPDEKPPPPKKRTSTASFLDNNKPNNDYVIHSDYLVLKK